MPPRAALAVAIALAVSVSVPAILLARALPPTSTQSVAVTGPQDALAVVVGSAGGSGRRVLATPRFPAVAEPVLALHVGTYRQPATAALRLEAFARGRSIGACTVPPTRYGDGSVLTCPLRSSVHVGRVTVDATGATGGLAIFAHLRPGRLPLAGSLLETTVHTGTWARLSAEWERLGVVRPRPFGPTLIVVGTALWLLACLAAVGLASRGSE